jgi:hypothetical protein
MVSKVLQGHTSRRVRTDNVGRVGTVAAEDGTVGTGSGGASDLGSSLPYDLGKVSSTGCVTWEGKVV